jgi:hypothetical protein
VTWLQFGLHISLNCSHVQRRKHSGEVVDHIAVHADRGVGVIRGRALGDDRDLAAGIEGQGRQAGNGIDLERGADAQHQIRLDGETARLLHRALRQQLAERDDIRLHLPAQRVQVATPSASNSASMSSSAQDAPQPVQLEVSIEPCTSIRIRVPAVRCTGVAGDQLRDLEQLGDRREAIDAAAAEATAGTLSDASLAAVTEALAICERVLRRRRILG